MKTSAEVDYDSIRIEYSYTSKAKCDCIFIYEIMCYACDVLLKRRSFDMLYAPHPITGILH